MNVSWNLKLQVEKNHNFLLHYNLVGGRRNQQLPVNILRRGSIFYYSINLHQRKHFYDFHDEKIVDDFLNSVYESFASANNYKIQGYAEIINYQQTELVNLENTRVQLTNLYKGCYFNPCIRGEIKKDILKRVIVNGSKGSSWVFKRFNNLQIIVTEESNFKNII